MLGAENTETPIISATFHINGSPNRPFLVDAANSITFESSSSSSQEDERNDVRNLLDEMLDRVEKSTLDADSKDQVVSEVKEATNDEDIVFVEERPSTIPSSMTIRFSPVKPVNTPVKPAYKSNTILNRFSEILKTERENGSSEFVRDKVANFINQYKLKMEREKREIIESQKAAKRDAKKESDPFATLYDSEPVQIESIRKPEEPSGPRYPTVGSILGGKKSNSIPMAIPLKPVETQLPPQNVTTAFPLQIIQPFQAPQPQTIFIPGIGQVVTMPQQPCNQINQINQIIQTQFGTILPMSNGFGQFNVPSTAPIPIFPLNSHNIVSNPQSLIPISPIVVSQPQQVNSSFISIKDVANVAKITGSNLITSSNGTQLTSLQQAPNVIITPTKINPVSKPIESPKTIQTSLPTFSTQKPLPQPIPILTPTQSPIKIPVSTPTSTTTTPVKTVQTKTVIPLISLTSSPPLATSSVETSKEQTTTSTKPIVEEESANYQSISLESLKSNLTAPTVEKESLSTPKIVESPNIESTKPIESKSTSQTADISTTAIEDNDVRVCDELAPEFKPPINIIPINTSNISEPSTPSKTQSQQVKSPLSVTKESLPKPPIESPQKRSEPNTPSKNKPQQMKSPQSVTKPPIESPQKRSEPNTPSKNKPQQVNSSPTQLISKIVYPNAVKTPPKSIPLEISLMKRTARDVRMNESISNAIEKSLVEDKSSEKKDKEEKEVESYRFKMGHRKKAIQAADNSFVIMDRADPRDNTTSSPKKKLKFSRCKSDIDCYFEYRKGEILKKRQKAAEEQNNEEPDVEEDPEDDDNDEGEVDELKKVTSILKKLSAKCEICGNSFLNEVSVKRHMRMVHRTQLREERDKKEGKDRDDFLSHLNSTLSSQTIKSSPYKENRAVTTATESKPEEASGSEKSLKRFHSDSSLLTNSGVRQSVYAKKPPIVATSATKPANEADELVDKDSGHRIGEYENRQSDYPHTFIDITYKKPPVQKSPRKAAKSQKESKSPTKTPTKSPVKPSKETKTPTKTPSKSREKTPVKTPSKTPAKSARIETPPSRSKRRLYQEETNKTIPITSFFEKVSAISDKTPTTKQKKNTEIDAKLSASKSSTEKRSIYDIFKKPTKTICYISDCSSDEDQVNESPRKLIKTPTKDQFIIRTTEKFIKKKHF